MGSTNDWMRDHLGGLADGQWLLADRQTAGRGRMGRPWQMLSGNLAASCVIRRRPGEGPAHQLGFVLALSLFDAAALFVPAARLMLKWPNDLMLDAAKLAGLLLEAHGPDVVVAGVGVNLAHAPAVPGRATAAIADAGRPAPGPLPFLEALAPRFETWRTDWTAHGFAAMRAAWQARAHRPGQRLSVTLGAGRIEGCYQGLDADGSLLLADAAGAVRRVLAADVDLVG